MIPIAVVFFSVLAAACTSAAAPPQPAAPAFDSARAFRHLEQIVAIGPRPAGSPGAQQTRAYITKELSALGITAEEQAFDADTPKGRIPMVNLRATIPGSGQGRLIVAGHYDTKLFENLRFVGANDGGSSTAFLIELARVLKERRNAFAIELLFLDGEEALVEWSLESDSTYGSRHYVDAARKAGTLKDIHAMILVDMIGDRDLAVQREPTSTAWLTAIIWSTARRLKRPEFVDTEFAVEDDHVPFLRAGVPAVDIIDLSYSTKSGAEAWHTAHDTLDNVSPQSMQAVGDVLLASLAEIEARIQKTGTRR